MLQVARFLLKAVMRLQKGAKVSPSVEYLSELAKGKLDLVIKESDLNCPYFVNSIIRNFACVSVKNMVVKLNKGIMEGLSEK